MQIRGSKFFLFLFHFLGGLHFALFLIATVISFVIAGTFLEEYFGSHLSAARFVYSNPVFITLLWLFFINILFAAMRRIPFQKKHIPFLLAHLGLLMILGGTLVKSHFGVQGSVVLREGTTSSFLFLDNTYALSMIKENERFLLPIKHRYIGPLPSLDPDLSFYLLKWHQENDEKIAIDILTTFRHQSHVVTLPLQHEAGKERFLFAQKFGIGFQKQEHPLPHQIRLREARSIPYLGTNQPYSYEADLLVDGSEASLTMNRVYQSKKGYRLYLANLMIPESFLAKKVVLVVGYDPAKYFLTYPGGIFLGIGMILFFWRTK